MKSIAGCMPPLAGRYRSPLSETPSCTAYSTSFLICTSPCATALLAAKAIASVITTAICHTRFMPALPPNRLLHFVEVDVPDPSIPARKNRQPRYELWITSAKCNGHAAAIEFIWNDGFENDRRIPSRPQH